MREREVIRIVAERLRSDGLAGMSVRYQGPGPDIEGVLPRSGRRLFVEAKGIRRNQSPRVALGEALLQILSRWDRDVVCALALPYTEEFVKILRTILPGVRRLGLYVILVRDERNIRLLSPQSVGFFPVTPLSLTEVMDG